jgi:hypothetical protein
MDAPHEPGPELWVRDPPWSQAFAESASGATFAESYLGYFVRIIASCLCTRAAGLHIGRTGDDGGYTFDF